MPATMSSTEENSSGVWLRPSFERTKIMTTLAMTAICCEVVAGPAGHRHERDALAARSLLERLHETGIAEAGRVVGGEAPLDVEPAAGGNLAHQTLVLAVEVGPRGRVRVSRIDREGDLARDDGRKPRIGDNSAHGRDSRPTHAMGGVDDTGTDLGEALHRVTAQVHRESAGVILHAGQLDEVVADAGDGVHDRDGQARLLEDRPLLDVKLHEALDIVAARLGDARGIEADGQHRIRHRLVGIAAHARGIIRPDPAGDRPRAPEIGRREPAPFLLAQ